MTGNESVNERLDRFGSARSLENVRVPEMALVEYESVPRAYLRDDPKVIPETTIKALRTIRVRWRTAQRDIDGSGDPETRLKDKRAALARKLAVGESVEGEEIPPLPVVQADVETLKQLGIETQAALGREAFRIAQAVYPTFLAGFEAWIVAKIRLEADLYASASVKFDDERSHFSAALRSSIGRLRKIWESCSVRQSAEPRVLFPFLELEEVKS